MALVFDAGAALEPGRHGVGRSESILVDSSRDDRVVPVDIWYPAAPDGHGERSVYELFPGIGFTATAETDVAVAAGRHPLVVWTHGRTGTRTTYVLLCEALAARGFMVAALEHAGDALADWILGAAVDDATNEINRVADVRFVLDELFDAESPFATITAHIDADRVAVAGHSYGGFTALALVGGTDPDLRVRAVAGLQSLTRSIPKQVLASITVPTLLVVGTHDATTPPSTDADRAWAKLGADPAWRVDVERAGHQACSDVGLYLELVHEIDDLPDLVRDYVVSMAPDVTGTAGDPWRETVALHIRILGAFLDGALAIDVDRATHDLESVAALPGVSVDQRGTFTPTP
jgi:predicted dienelactone hydrolase